MCTKKDVVVFLAGASAFHTISHIALSASGLLPLKVFSFNITPQFNMYCIVINAVITLALLWWASKLK